MKYQYLTTFLLFAAFFQANGQTFRIFGTVLDAQNGAGLPGAHVQLFQGAEEMRKNTIADRTGKFVLEGVERGDYRLEITYVGYQTYRKVVEVRDRDLNLGALRLGEGVELEEVEVRDRLPIATQQGDTTQYNADAFKTLPDADAEELVSKMPGVVVSDGQVQAQGEDVEQVLVDGRPFFGRDPRAALRNLPAEVIDKIQIFDQKSDQAEFTGFDDGETIKTLNLITRPNMRNGTFGKMYAGYGDAGTYKTGASVNFFNEDQRITLLGQSNNINQQNFSSEDLLGVMAGRGRSRRGSGGGGMRGGGGRGGMSGGGMRGGGGDARDFMVGQQGGISTTHALGLNYTDDWGEKLQVTGGYFLNNSDNVSDQLLNQEFFNDFNDFNQIYAEESGTESTNLNHRFNMRMDYTIDENNSIIFRPRLTLQQNDGTEITLGENTSGDVLLNETDYNFASDLRASNFSSSLTYRHRFGKRGRTFSLSVNTGFNDQSGESFLNSESNFYGRNAYTELIRQYSDLLTDGWTWRTNAMYTEPLSEKGILQVNYTVSYQPNDSDRETFGFEEATSDYTLLYPELSNTFSNKYIAQSAGAGYRLQGKGFFLTTRMNFQWANLDNEQVYPLPLQPYRTFYNVLPSIFFRRQFSRAHTLNLGYTTRTSPPSITQLQEVIDNSNPLQWSTGNPDLKQNYGHNIFVRYNKTNTDKSSVFFAGLFGGVTQNYIANSTFFANRDSLEIGQVTLPPGVQLTRPVNLDGYWNLRSFVTYGKPVARLKSNLNVNLSANYSRRPGMIDEVQNFTNTVGFGLGIVLSSNISDKVDFNLSSQSNINNATNDVNENLNTQYFNQRSRLTFNWIFGKGFVLRTNVSHQFYDGLSQGFNQNFWLWNASIGKKLFKNDRGEIQLSVFDLLGQNTSINRTVTELYIQDLQTAVLQRYVMLNFIYNLRNFTGMGNTGFPQRPPGGRPPFMRN